MRMTATNDEGLEDSPSHTNEDPVMSSNGLKFREGSPPVHIRPSNRTKKDTSPTTTPLPLSKKISSTKKKSATKSTYKRKVIQGQEGFFF